MTYKQILHEHENQYKIINDISFGKVIETFKQRSNLDVENIIYGSGIPKDNEQAFFTLYSYLLNHASDEMPKMDEVLEQFGFNFKRILGSYIRLLGSIVTDTIPDYVNNTLLRVPVIDELECKSGKITIYSDKLGIYSFTTIKKHFENSFWISRFLNSSSFDNDCHNGSWKLIEYLKNARLVTLLLPGYFKGTNYHTVIQDEQNHMIDIAHASVFEMDSFKRLMEGTVVCETERSEMYEKLAQATENTEYAHALVLALHQQSKL